MIKVTFEEWLENEMLIDALYSEAEFGHRHTPKEIIKFMRRAWDARYQTLTYNDL